MKKKRVLVAADFHAGHLFGLTPPGWWIRGGGAGRFSPKVSRFQRRLWHWYEEAVNALKPIDTFLMPGDAIEGKGDRSGGLELLTADRHEQALMAAVAIDVAEAGKIRLAHGTRYHTGKDEDFEDTILQAAKCEDSSIGDHDWFDCNGKIIDMRHYVPGSSIDYMRHTAGAREHQHNLMWWANGKRQPKADILIRGHNHYYKYEGDANFHTIHCPALCYNSSFGKRQCSGIVNVGIVWIDFLEDGGFECHAKIADFAELRVRPEKI